MMFSSSKALGLFTVLLAIPALTGATYVPPAPQPSGGPQCRWKCPSVDEDGKPLTFTSNFGVLYCQYKIARPCYYKSNGDIKIDIYGKCPSKAEHVCNTPSRRDVDGVYKAYQEQKERRAALPAPSVPNHMHTRAGLKKRSKQL